MQLVEVVLYFAVGQFAVDQVAGTVVAVAAFDGGLAITATTLVLPLPPSVRSLRVAICRFRLPYEANRAL